MKRFLSAALALLMVTATACKKDGPKKEPVPTKQDFYVNVWWTKSNYPGNRIAMPSNVYLFEDPGKDVDIPVSYYALVKATHTIMFEDGTTAPAKYISSTGSNEFKDIPDGNYIIWVDHSPIDVSGYYAAMKRDTVDIDYRWRSETMLFNLDNEPGFYPWNDPNPKSKSTATGPILSYKECLADPPVCALMQ
ncbi:MAG: hypothetical protein LBU80_00890 [Rikenellaceae bacterium]|jgi:hypothetical protein|nr:hypothetical protein [Rikenellaceae bacterium]